MRVIVQRVLGAQVEVEGQCVASIGRGMLVLVGVEAGDGEDDILWLAAKLARLRIFADAAGVMNCSVLDVAGEVLAVSQFTLFASLKKGNRPSWNRAARPELSQPLFDRFVLRLASELGRSVPTGVFGADMKVSLVNDGPVTLCLDSKNPE